MVSSSQGQELQGKVGPCTYVHSSGCYSWLVDSQLSRRLQDWLLRSFVFECLEAHWLFRAGFPVLLQLHQAYAVHNWLQSVVQRTLVQQLQSLSGCNKEMMIPNNRQLRGANLNLTN